MEEVPAGLKNAAIAQIVAGLLNIFMMAWVTYIGVGMFCGILTILLGGIGGMCGMVGCLLIPFGVAEVVVGALALTNPKQFGSLSRMLGYVEVLSILMGSLTSAVAGAVVISMTGSDEVKLYLES